MAWIWNQRVRSTKRRARNGFVGFLETLEQRICLTDTVFGRVYHDVTGNLASADDLPVAGWTFQVREVFVDYFPATDDLGNTVRGQRAYLQTANLVTDAQGYFYYTRSVFSDPTPISESGQGYAFAAQPIYAVQDMAETPDYRGYYAGVTHNTAMFDENLLWVDMVGTGATPEELIVARSNGAYYERRVYQPVMLSGTFFEDWNGDGIQQEREPRFANQRVSTGYRWDFLSGTQYAYDDVYTDAFGNFTMEIAPTPIIR